MQIIQPGIELHFVLNVQFQSQMTFIYGGAAVGMGIYYKSHSVMQII